MKSEIKKILGECADSGLKECAEQLLGCLGYKSDRTYNLSGSVSEFIQRFPASNENTQSEKKFSDNAKSVDIVFQVTEQEITAHNGIERNSFARRNSKSFIFIAVGLKGNTHSRSQYARFTREISKRLPMPAVVFFKTNNGHISLAFADRRRSHTNNDLDVLRKVSLVREVNPRRPHTAHLTILSELALKHRLLWMEAHGKDQDFDGLLEAWLDVLDTEELNQRFYRDLFSWFERVISTASFPDDSPRKKQEQTIRLITRLLFIWFIKEKGLIADELFNDHKIQQLINDHSSETSDSYYRVILQNLFFATLNTKIPERKFSLGKSTSAYYYCYKDEMKDQSELQRLFNMTPFINGSLFDCLDSSCTDNTVEKCIDCFSDDPDIHGNYFIPNCLFLGNEGLIPLLRRYKFTVEENTPADQEVALDPELLGKVFENLLAVYNPETKGKARKETGSFYTPRPVVDYMVDEALVEVLAEKLQSERARIYKQQLYDLLNYSKDFESVPNVFTAAQKRNGNYIPKSARLPKTLIE